MLSIVCARTTLGHASMSSNPSIYLTYKTRMVAEARCRFRARFSDILVAWYSLWLIALSIIDLKASDGSSHAVLLVIVSIFVFALSLIVPALGFGEAAVKHRECYLRLQRLNLETLADEVRDQRYFDVLEGYPNHSDADWDTMLVQAAKRGQILHNRTGPIVVTKAQYRYATVRPLVSGICYLALISVPVVALAWTT